MLLRIVWLCKAGDATGHETIVSVLGLAHRPRAFELWATVTEPLPQSRIQTFFVGS